MSSTKPRVLLTNDDGPPGRDSPYVYGLWKHLAQDLGWDVKVVVPSSQKSWIGKAYQIKDIIKGRYYYPKGPDGAGAISETSRPLEEGEVAEWILLDGTPATCTNIALHNLYKGEIDLVISGPNLGRNTSSAFLLSSGTVGAALSGALSLTRSIAISYGTMKTPVTNDLHDPAHRLAGSIVSHLLSNWGSDEAGLRPSGEVDLYTINIPMIAALHKPEEVPIEYTTIWRNSYGRLFKAYDPSAAPESRHRGPAAGPDAPQAHQNSNNNNGGEKQPGPEAVSDLVFQWKPDMSGILNPRSIPAGTDAHALDAGRVSVTPLRAGYSVASLVADVLPESEERLLKMKL